MIVLRARLLPQKIAANACRSFVTEKTGWPKYWHAICPDGKPRSFDEMPTVEEPRIDPYKQHEIYPQWFKKYGYVVRQPVGDGKFIVHTFHFDDFDTVYYGDLIYFRKTRQLPQRSSHQVVKHYRENNKHLYDNVGLGPGNGDFVGRMRDLIKDSKINNEKMEEVTDDLIKIIKAKVGEGGEIELLPWLSRWSFENVGLKFLNKRLGALSPTGNEEADKMMEAAAITNEMVALTTLDPETDYDERYRKVESAQNYFYSVLKKYIEEEIATQPDSNCSVKKISENNPKDAITVTLDGFQGALQTVSLTVLMALYNYARSPKIQVEAREVLMKYLPSKDSKIFSSSNHYPPGFMQNSIWETLRLNPPIIGNGRIIKSDIVLGGYNVPKENSVIMHFQVAGRLEEFFEDPLKFDPKRFEFPKRIQYANICDRVRNVFGGGFLRQCIGESFALHIMSTILSKILQNFEFSYDGEDIAMINRLHNEPEKPLFLKLKPVLD